MSNEEHRIQSAIIEWAEMAKCTMPELRLLHAIPNGGKRNVVVAAKLKREGVKRGAPDLCLPVARSHWHGLYIEVKTERGRLSPEQRQWQADLTEQGYFAVVVRSVDAAIGLLTDHLRARKCSAVCFADIAAILRGIDSTETESEHGWWETDAGAKFGSAKMEEIERLFSR